ncbi:hypothetical protein D3C78_1469880 [compost metagenome]
MRAMDRKSRCSPGSVGESGRTAWNPQRPTRSQFAAHCHEAVKALTGVKPCRTTQIACKVRIPGHSAAGPRLAHVM